MKRVHAALLMAALCAACDSATIPQRDPIEVFDFRLPDGGDSLVVRWPLGSQIRVFVQPMGDAVLDEGLRAAFHRGADAWHDAALFGEFRLIEVDWVEEADAILTYSNVPLPVNVSDCLPAGGRGFTTFCLTDDRQHLEVFPLEDGATGEGHVRYILSIRATEAASQTTLDALVAHEIGHLLGIGQHSPNPADLMWRDALLRTVPNARDRATIQLLYHTVPNITP